MDVLERINQLRKEKGWSVNRLALESGLTQSTLFNLFYRKSSPSIKTLESICQGLGITLDRFFEYKTKNELNGKISNLNESELHLVSKYRKLNEEQKKLTTKFIDNFN